MKFKSLFLFLIFGILIFSSLDLASADHQCMMRATSCAGFEPGVVYDCDSPGMSGCLPVVLDPYHGKSSEPGAGFSALDFFENKLEWIRTGADLETSGDFLESCKKACSDQPEECDERCKYRNNMADILPSLILCEYALKNTKERTTRDILINGVVPEYYTPNGLMYDLNDDLRKERGEDNAVPEGHAYQIILKNYDQYLSEIPQDTSRPPEFPEELYPYYPYGLVTGQRKEACDKELSRLSKEELTTPYAEDEPTETAVPSPTDQETFEKGGTLKEWKEKLQSETGPDSAPSKTAAACGALMKQKTAECSQHGGWRTDYMVEIADFRTDEHYELQDIRNGGCPDISPTGEEYPYARIKEVDTTNLDSQAEGGESAYQVVCSVLCSSWSCGESKTGTAGAAGGIESLKGKVEAMQPDGSWKKVKVGTAIYLNGSLRTGKDGKVVIKLADDTVFTIGQNSSLVIDEFVYDPTTNIGKLTASLINGVFRFVSGKMIKGDPFANIKFRLHDLVIGVRGTDFILSYDPDTKTSILHLYKGNADITLTSTGNKEEFNAGQTVFVEDARITKTLPLSQEEWSSLVDENELAEESSSSFFVNSVILIILIAGVVLIIRKIKKRKDSTIIKKQSVEHKKSEKISGETKKWGIASLILAIFSILFLLLPFVGIALAILAVVFARLQKKHNPTKIATAGLVIGIISIVLNILVLIAVVQ